MDCEELGEVESKVDMLRRQEEARQLKLSKQVKEPTVKSFPKDNSSKYGPWLVKRETVGLGIEDENGEELVGSVDKKIELYNSVEYARDKSETRIYCMRDRFTMLETQMNFLIGNRSLLQAEQLSGIHQLRYDVFVSRLGWSTSVTGLAEVDEYDNLNPVFFAALGSDKQVNACCRVLPTTGSYMLRKTFPSLLGSASAPESENIWEISRFAVDKESGHRAGLSVISSQMVAILVKYAVLSKIDRYIFATTTGVEKLLKRIKVNCERVSPSVRIGKDECVAMWMHIDDITITAVSSVAPELFDRDRKVA